MVFFPCWCFTVFPCGCITWSYFPVGASYGLLSLLVLYSLSLWVHHMVFFPCWCFIMVFFPCWCFTVFACRCITWSSFPVGASYGFLSLLVLHNGLLSWLVFHSLSLWVHHMVFFPNWCFIRSSFPAGVSEIFMPLCKKNCSEFL